ncbi:hypothetical protein TNIN_301211 [Trichonephila inaurata madagascariensis]|uniref:Uncharacterized protein n=1 Tax=Trichonephila inaurata madagascariensis TaxID=2747483 RepID=A0A8X7C8M0_9ARAC|nr:hypothetical protein TNIN_301211 [Trichonephila inaurata madagascariensis]
MRRGVSSYAPRNYLDGITIRCAFRNMFVRFMKRELTQNIRKRDYTRNFPLPFSHISPAFSNGHFVVKGPPWLFHAATVPSEMGTN